MHYSYTVLLYRVNIIRYLLCAFFNVFNKYVHPHVHKGNDFAVLRKYHINKKGKRSDIIPATWGMRSQSCSRNTARAERLVFGKLSPSRTCAWKRAWSDDQKARAENCFHSRRSIFFQTWNSQSAWKNTRPFVHWWSICCFFCRCYIITSKRTRLQLFHPSNEQKHMFTNVFLK